MAIWQTSVPAAERLMVSSSFSSHCEATTARQRSSTTGAASISGAVLFYAAAGVLLLAAVLLAVYRLIGLVYAQVTLRRLRETLQADDVRLPSQRSVAYKPQPGDGRSGESCCTLPGAGRIPGDL